MNLLNSEDVREHRFQNGTRRSYAKPVLTHYGDVRDVTLGIGTSDKDGGSQEEIP